MPRSSSHPPIDPSPPSDDARQLAAAVVRALERIATSRIGGSEHDVAYAHGRVLGVLDGLAKPLGISVASTIERLDAIEVRAESRGGGGR